MIGIFLYEIISRYVDFVEQYVLSGGRDVSYDIDLIWIIALLLLACLKSEVSLFC
jgi:hypothetical protein